MAITGVLAGFINVVAGGGSMLSVPALVLLGVPGPVANGTNRIAMIAQAASATYTFWRRGVSHWGLALSLSLAMLPGALCGAFVGTLITGEWFDRFLGIILLGVLISMRFEARVSVPVTETNAKLARPAATHLAVGLLGFYGGLIHIGIGFFIMLVLSRLGGLELVRVNMLKMAIVGPYSLVALGVYWHQSGILWLAGLALAAGNVIGAWLGANFSIDSGARAVRFVFNLCILGLVAKLLFF
ncbi:MAG: sulfite exporter TauE/SafE family protein [Pseudomonadota bacterium]